MKLLSPITENDERIILEAAAAVGVDSLLFRRVRSLSGGETQRVVTAMVMAQQPEIFLLDEPTSSLDPSHCVKIFGLLPELADAGKTVVIAAHDINAAAAYSDDYIAVKEGEIIASGSAGAIGSEILETLYGTNFFAYRSEGGDVVWHTRAER